MRQNKLNTQGCEPTDDMQDRQLMSLLQELVREEGVMKAARVLEVSYRMVSSTMRTERPSQKMRWALERLQFGERAPAVEWRERNLKLGAQIDELEENLRTGLKDMKTALEDFRTETASELQRVDRWLTDLASGRGDIEKGIIGDVDGGDQMKRDGLPWKYQRVPTEPMPDNMYALVLEWRQALAEFMTVEEELSKVVEGDMALMAHSTGMPEALAKSRTPRRRQLSKRKLAPSETNESIQTQLG